MDTSGSYVTQSARNRQLACVPPGAMPAATYSRAAAGTGTASAQTSAVTPLAAVMLRRWPSRPNPVTSVRAWTSSRGEHLGGAAVERRHHPDRLADRPERSSPFLAAVVMIPRPSGLVRMSTSPGLAPALVRTWSGWTVPTTARPKIGSSRLDRVAADDGDARLGRLVGRPAEDVAEHLGRQLVVREADDAQGGQRLAAHRVDVAQGVGGGDPRRSRRADPRSG